jgi:hypothetical protein
MKLVTRLTAEMRHTRYRPAAPTSSLQFVTSDRSRKRLPVTGCFGGSTAALGVTQWRCVMSAGLHDRDINGARNIEICRGGTSLAEIPAPQAGEDVK